MSELGAHQSRIESNIPSVTYVKLDHREVIMIMNNIDVLMDELSL